MQAVNKDILADIWGINMDFLALPHSNDEKESCTFSILHLSTWLSRLKNRYETLFSDAFYVRFGS